MRKELKFVLALIGMILMSDGYSNEKELSISNLRVGLECGVGRENRKICFETEMVHITGEGICVWNNDKVPCTWYGFSFDYNSQKADILLNCIYTSSKSSTFGNVNEVTDQDATQTEFEIKLSGKDGHFYNPQYSVFSDSPKHRGKIITNKTLCKYENKKVFETQINLLYPEY